MKKGNRPFKMYLEDIHLAMERIAEYIEGYTFIKFKQDYKTVDAVIRNFEIIGEAAKKYVSDRYFGKFVSLKSSLKPDR
jgi:uncharacterized protein with HEPN domain